MPYKKGDVLKSGESRRKVLEVLGDIYFTSYMWKHTEDGGKNSKLSGTWCNELELDIDGWSLCPPDQTLLPTGPWKPEEGEVYYWGYIDSTEDVYSNHTTFDSDNKTDQKRLAMGNTHKTSEEAIEWACKRYGITKPWWKNERNMCNETINILIISITGLLTLALMGYFILRVTGR